MTDATLHHSAPERSRQIRRALAVVLGLNLAVVAVKVVAWIASGSLSVGGEVIHSTLDAANNVLALTFARVSSRGPDDHHPYGHSKFEHLGALVVAGFLSVSVFEITRGAVGRLLGTREAALHVTPLVLWLMAFSMAVSIAVAWWEAREARRLRSSILAADSAHTQSDVLSTLAVIVGLVLVYAGFPQADAWVALAVALLIARSGYRIFRDAVPILVDERLVDPTVIADVALQVPGVLGCQEIRSRGPEGLGFVELVITVDGAMSVDEGHAIADEVEARVAEEVGASLVSVHVEPDS